MQQSEKVYISEIIKGLIPGFLASRENEFQLMQKSVIAADYEAMKKLGHKLKGSNYNYGFKTLGQLSEEFERAGSDKNSARAQAVIEQMRDHLKNIEIIFVADEGLS